MKRDPARKLSEEDRILWRRVTDTITPIGPRERASRADFAALLEPRTENPRSDRPGAETKCISGKIGQPPPVPVQKSRLAIERPVREKISKGRVQLDARIDLHGMTQHQAHSMLLNFLHQAWRHQLRHVLVITGKGSSLGSDGVLARAVPEWFATPAFHPFVSGYSLAARHHGGQGAVYVRLRRKKDGRKP